MPMSLNVNKAPIGLGDTADEKLAGRETRPRDEAAVYALASRADASSLSALKDSLDRAASSARLAVVAVEQIGGVLIEMREKAAGASDDDHKALAAAVGRLEALTPFATDEGAFGLALRDFALGGSILDLGDGTGPALDLAIGKVASASAEMEAETRQIEKHVALVARLQDMLAKRVGSLVDADMNQDAARLQALQIQQQLGAQGLSLANSQPQALLELFRGD